MSSRAIVKSVSILTVIVLIGKGLGFFREIVIGAVFGATIQTDMFFLANGVVANVLYALSTAISVAFFPVLTNIIVNKKKQEGEFIGTSILILAIVALAIFSLIEVFAGKIAMVIAPGYAEKEITTVALYIRILAISFIFSLICSILNKVLDAHKRYGYSRISGILYSVLAIISVLIFGKEYGVISLVLTVPIAYSIQMFILIVQVSKNIHWGVNIGEFKKDISKIIVLMFPILLSNATVLINQVIGRGVASILNEGMVSALSYSGTLTDFVNAVFSSSIATVLFTEISANCARNEIESVKKNVESGFSYTLIALIPIIATTVLYAPNIVSCIYERGAFDSRDTELVAIALTGYAIGFLFTGIKSILVNVYYSFENTVAPTIISSVSVAVNIIIMLLLYKPWGIFGITFASSASEAVAAIILYLTLRKKIGRIRVFNIKNASAIIAGITTVIIVCSVGSINFENKYLYFISNTGLLIMCYLIFIMTFNFNDIRKIIWKRSNK